MTYTEKDLSLVPLEGKSGKAYMGTYPDGSHVFVKLNTTPILAGLAKEQIAPQLLWSKRVSNGSVMTAQEWLSGRVLTREDMHSKQIINILTRLHRSRPLVNQLEQLGYKPETPYDLLQKWAEDLPNQLRQNTYLQQVYNELRHSTPSFPEEQATIVHGDIHHSNWVITTGGMIYLVDWDTVRLTDRMFDVAHILSHYVPKFAWREWLTYYGYKYNQTVLDKVMWYGQLAFLYQISKAFDNHRLENVNREIYGLRQFRDNFKREL